LPARHLGWLFCAALLAALLPRRAEPACARPQNPASASFGSYIGRVVVEGYARLEERPGSNAPWVVLVVVKAEPAGLIPWLKTHADDPALRADGIVLGCLDRASARIVYLNQAGGGDLSGEIAGPPLRLLLASTPEHPVEVGFERPIAEDRSSPSPCYSRFRDYRVRALPPL
jgi:hypothetical protein